MPEPSDRPAPAPEGFTPTLEVGEPYAGALDDLRWRCAAFHELSLDELYALMLLRQRVFVVEQNCPYVDADGDDQGSWHLWAHAPDDPTPLAYVRIVPGGLRYPEPSIGRVITAPEARRIGLGKVLMRRAIAETRRRCGGGELMIGAQTYLGRFYEELGFVAEGDGYDEDGIPHVHMRLAADPEHTAWAPDRSRVVLRPLGEEDVDDILSWVNDPNVVGNLAAFSGKPFTREDELNYVRAMQASTSDRVFSVLAADDGRYLGQVGLHQIHARSKVGRMAVVIARRGEMGKGFGSAAVASLLDQAFGAEGLRKVWLMVFAHNHRSLGIYARIGFQVEGRLRGEYFHEGDWHTMVRMGLLAEEWTAP
jgi:ElaA protein